MDELEAIEYKLDRFCTNVTNIHDRADQNLDDLISFISNIKKNIDGKVEAAAAGDDGDGDYKLNDTDTSIIREAIKQVNETVKYTANAHRQLHLDLSKTRKLIDRNFNTNLHEVSNGGGDRGEKRISILSTEYDHAHFNRAICQHLYLDGLDLIGDTLSEEGGVITEEFKPFILEQRRILQSLREKDLLPLIDWISINLKDLKKRKSELEYKTIRMQFLLLVQNGNPMSAILLARSKLSSFATTRERDIQKLMGVLAFSSRELGKSPYAQLFSEDYWKELMYTFRKESQAVLQIPAKSPLSVCFSAGCDAIRDKMKFCEMAKNDKQLALLRKDPSVEISEEFFFHSIFSCPILKEQVTLTNPPLRLDCGHVISKEALYKSLTFGRKKCPYCPLKTLDRVREIKF